MANIKVVKDNTMPPTDCLWRKVNIAGEVEGLYAWNGCRWVKIEGSSSSGSPLVFTDKDGNQVETSSFVESSDGKTISFFDKDGNEIIVLLTDKSSSGGCEHEDLVWIEDSPR